MLVIGLTGGIGCGKSTVAEAFASLGATIIDTDRISHQLTATGQPALQALREQFGGDCFLPDGSLDRPRLRQRVFSDPVAKEKLETLLHPLIRDEVRRRLEAAQAPYVIVVVPLLLETGAYRNVIQRILVVDCAPEQQVSRVMARSAMKDEEVRAIMAHQIERAERLRRADDILDNHGDSGEISAQVAQLHQRYLSLSGAGRA